MKVALISPYSSITSIGVRSISATLKSHGFLTRIIFLPLQKGYHTREDFLLYPDEVIESVANLVKSDDVIGISLMSNYYDSIKDLTQKLKTKLPAKPIIWGGIHPTVRPDQCIEVADYVCIGEAEKSLLQFCQNFTEGKPLDNIPGIWSKTGSQIHKNSSVDVVMDLTTIPPPDYDLEDHYVLLPSNSLLQITKNNIIDFIGNTYSTMYTRGCAFSCSYCCNSALRKINKSFTKLRPKSPEYIVREIEAVTDKFPYINYIIFEDDTFSALSEDDIDKFSKYYKKHIDLPFIIGGIHPALFTEKKYDSLIDCGLMRIRMGIQTGSEKMKKLYERKQNSEIVINAAALLQKHSDKIVMPNYDIILDNPWENTDDKLDTIALLQKLAPPYSLTLYSLTFFPGTSLYSKAIDEQVIDEKVKHLHYLNYEPTYLNLIIALHSLFKVPKWLLNLFLSEAFVNTKENFSFTHRALFNLILFRKATGAILKGDISLLPPKLQLFLSNIMFLKKKRNVQKISNEPVTNTKASWKK